MLKCDTCHKYLALPGGEGTTCPCCLKGTLRESNVITFPSIKAFRQTLSSYTHFRNKLARIAFRKERGKSICIDKILNTRIPQDQELILQHYADKRECEV